MKRLLLLSLLFLSFSGRGDEPIVNGTSVRYADGAAVVAHTAPLATVTLPVEIYALDGSSAHNESITLSTANASSVDSIYVQAHQPFYHIGGNLTQCVVNCDNNGFDAEGAARMRVNGGAWIEIRDNNVDCAFPERKYDCVAGPYSTIRFTVSASASGALVDGDNTVTFRFNGSQGIRSGWRVRMVGFMTSSSPTVQDFNPFGTDGTDGDGAQTNSFTIDYDDSAPPSGYNNTSDINAGETLWLERNILEEVPTTPGGSGANITASCSMCHAHDGRDLKYFRYSNRTIIARSQAHGLSENEGKQIAAYIRSIDLKKENGATYDPPGTPYDPPYQPGLGYGPNKDQSPDAVDQVYWAAGAGLKWVLDWEREGQNGPDYRRDMMAHLFPKGGDPANGVAMLPDGSLDWTKIAMDNTINMRELPINIMFPDWNNWLPDIHPIDADTDLFTGSQAESHYNNNIRGGMSGSVSSKANDLQTLFSYVDKSDDNLQNLSFQSFTTDFEGGTAQQSVYQWTLVKTWEALHSEHLEDKADDIYNSGSQQYNEPRGWPINSARTAFEVGPHVADNRNTPSNPDPYSYYGDEAGDFYFSHIWYHLQVIVMPRGSETSSGQNPTDWGYQDNYLNGTCGAYQIGCALRQASSFLKMWQTANNEYGADGLGNDFDRDSYHGNKMRRGWTAHTADYDMIFAWTPNSFKGDIRAKNMGIDERTDLLEAMMRAWWDHVQTIPIVDFPQGGGNGAKFYPAHDDLPSIDAGWGKKNYQNKLYRGLYDVAENLPGVDTGLLDSLVAWGDAMWPDDRSSNTISMNTVATNNNPNPSTQCCWGTSNRPYRWDEVIANATGVDPGGGTPSGGSGGDDGGGEATNPPVNVGTATLDDGELFGDGHEAESGSTIEYRCRGEDDDGTGLVAATYCNQGVATDLDGDPYCASGGKVDSTSSPNSNNPIFTGSHAPADGSYSPQCIVYDNEGATVGNTYDYTITSGAETQIDTLDSQEFPFQFLEITGSDATCTTEEFDNGGIVRLSAEGQCHYGLGFDMTEIGDYQILAPVDSVFVDAIGGPDGVGVYALRAGKTSSVSDTSQVFVEVYVNAPNYTWARLRAGYVDDSANNSDTTYTTSGYVFVETPGTITFTKHWVSSSDKEISAEYDGPGGNESLVSSYSVPWTEANTSFGVRPRCTRAGQTNCELTISVSDFLRVYLQEQ